MSRLLGALLWSLFLLFTLLYTRREEARRLRELGALCRLITHLRDALSDLPRPLAYIYDSFHDDTLKQIGFLDVLQREGLHSALTSGVLHLEKEVLAPLVTYAEAQGERLWESEKQALSELLSHLRPSYETRQADAPRRARLFSTLFFSGGMMLLLLLL